MDESLYNTHTASVEEAWGKLKSSLLHASEKVFGWTKEEPPRKQPLWNNEVNFLALKKRKCWKDLKNAGSKEPYLKIVNCKTLSSGNIHLQASKTHEV